MNFSNHKKSNLVLHKICKTYGSFFVLNDLTVTIPQGSFTCFLGPSGSGKTTLLRIIAGLDHPTKGQIFWHDQDISPLSVQERNFGIVFQNYALFPNLTVEQNIAFGLQNLHTPKSKIAEDIDFFCDAMHLQMHRHKYPWQLSAGQQQRVALARSLALKPDILLLDEPLSALDNQIRIALQKIIIEFHYQFNLTTIFVTHDQEEAFLLADQIIVLHEGEIKQIGTPKEIYGEPNSLFMAKFIGLTNILPAQITSQHSLLIGSLSFEHDDASNYKIGEQVHLSIRPEHIKLVKNPTNNLTHMPIYGSIKHINFMGPFYRIHFHLEQIPHIEIIVDLSTQHYDEFHLNVTDKIWLELPKKFIKIYQ
ncbi:MAG: ATP-binding cassette domain-containing protein [Alphaproteobacteria bacterium]|nr:ATP-binding cassette domain-containing protein [Alphaproteobacteria bacterium]